MKKCRKCCKVWDLSHFHKNKGYSKGLDARCKECRKLYYLKTRAHQLSKKKAWQKVNKDRVTAYIKNWRLKNPDKVKASRDRNAPTKNLRNRLRKQSDFNYKFKLNLKNKIKIALINKGKSAPSEVLLGTTINGVRDHLESQFKPMMNWSTYGIYGWHIDHIRPLSSFDLKNPLEQLKAFHYTNLQPLWASDNLKKGSKLDI